MNAGRLRITHIITGLSTGGAETMLYKLLAGLRDAASGWQVISLSGIGAVGERIQELGVRVEALGMKPGRPDGAALLRLARRLRAARPHAVQTWMYHADLVGGLAARLASIPVVWGIRNSTLDARYSKRSTIWTVKLCARLSGWLPARIISCSEVARQVHIGLGYTAHQISVIPNGFDTRLFRPDASAGAALRAGLGLPPETYLIGLVARFDPQKDHPSFIQAAARLHTHLPEAHFILAGDGITWQNNELSGWIENAGLRNCFHLLGRREDMPRLTAALDIASSSSAYGEAFSNALGEAMACGVPCVATDVGDARLIIGESGRVVPPRDPQKLAGAWLEVLRLPPGERLALGLAARRRVEEHFSLEQVAQEYLRLYQTVAGQR